MKAHGLRELIGLAVVLAIATATRFYQLGEASLWLDEILTIKLSTLPLSTLWITAYDPTPPLYYSLSRLVLNFGDSEWLLRLPSAVCGVLTILVIYAATRSISGAKAAFATALLLSFSLPNIEFSQEARAYALLGLWISISFLGLAWLYSRWQDSSSGFTQAEFLKSGGGLYALGLIGALYTHNIAVFYWGGVQLFFLAWWARPFRFSVPPVLGWFVLNLLLLVLWLPWLFASMEVIEANRFVWLRQYDFQTAFATWRNVHGLGIHQPRQHYFDIFILALGLIGLYSLRRHISIVVLLVSLLVFSFLVIWVYGFVGTPVFMARTILWGSLFSAVLVGIGIGRLPEVVGYLVLLAVLIPGAIGVRYYFENNIAENEDWKSAAAVFNEKQQAGDIILFRSTYINRPFLYYADTVSSDWEILGWSCNKQSVRTGRLIRENGQARAQWDESGWKQGEPLHKKPGNNLWIVESHCNPRSWAEANAWLAKNWRLLETHRFRQVRIYRLAPL